MSLTKIKASNITSTGVVAGSYTNTSITVNESGQVTGISSGAVATTSPRITSIAITDNTWATLDDTAVDISGGYIKITGTSFSNGCLVYFNQTPANSVSFVSTTELRVTTGTLSAGTYVLYVINSDGGVAISVPGVTFSATPAWQTSSALPDQYDETAISLSLVAADATSYAITAGSLPPGLTLNSSTGAITGTVTGVTVNTTYTFTVRATDAQLQDSPRTFTVTITISDPYFRLTTLLLTGDSGNTVVRDSSLNNFNLTVVGDARASNFTPYGTGWSAYFDGTGDYLSYGSNAIFGFGTADFTVEAWVYITASADFNIFNIGGGAAGSYGLYWVGSTSKFESVRYGDAAGSGRSTNTYGIGQWYHIAASRSSGTARLFINGNIDAGSTYAMGSVTATAAETGRIWQGSALNNGYISNLRVITGTALYTANFTPATTNLTPVANTSLLTCQSNRFVDNSSNNFTITRNGDTRIVGFNPFNITNVGTSGSMYFDGTGDTVTLSNSAIAFGTGEFCIESWIYNISLKNYSCLVTTRPNNSTYADAYHIGWDSAGGVSIFVNTTSRAGGPSGTMKTGVWQHFVCCRNSANLVSIFVDGVRVGSETVTENFSRSLLGIGDFPTTQAEGMIGYFSNLRLIKGSTPYDPTQTSITVPTSPLTAIANTQLLTLQYRQPHNNHGFQDSSSNQFLITRSGNTSQGTFSPFSQAGWSNYFDGTGDYLSIASNAVLAPGTGNFWIECWINLNNLPSSGSTYAVLQNDAVGVSGNDKFWFGLTNNTGTYRLQLGRHNTSDASYVNWTPAVNTWYHIAYGRSSGTSYLFIDGVSQTVTGSLSGVSFGQNGAVIGAVSTPYYFPGYISNLRYIVGAVLYTATFTPSSVPLTTTSQGASASQVEILTCQSNRFIDVSTNNFTITRNGDVSVQAFSPFAPAAVYSAAIHGGSAYFDISGDYLSTPSTTQLDFGTGDFTIEFYFYAIAANYAASEGVWPFFSGEGYFGESSSVNWDLIYYDGSQTFNFARRLSGTDSSVTSNTVTLPKLSWNHLAVVRNSGTVKFYLNGTDIGGGSFTNNINLTSILNINRRRGGNGTVVWYANMYMSSIRIVKGTAVYTAAFTPPTAPVTATTNTQLLLNFTDSAIQDLTGRNVIETVADARTSTAQIKYGTGSKYFDGTGDWVVTPTSPNFGYGTGDFTIEFWMYWTGAGTQTIVSNLTNSSSVNPHLYLSSGVLVYFTAGADRITGSSITANQWYHIALTRASGSTKLFVNGVQSGSTYADSNNYGTTAPFGLATYWNNGTPNSASVYSGYIDDLRITRGYARYTTNFTPPTVSPRLK